MSELVQAFLVIGAIGLSIAMIVAFFTIAANTRETNRHLRAIADHLRVSPEDYGRAMYFNDWLRHRQSKSPEAR